MDSAATKKVQTDEKLLNSLRKYIADYGEALPYDGEEQRIKQGKQRLEEILKRADCDTELRAAVKEIRGYEKSGEIQQNKLYGFCYDFVDEGAVDKEYGENKQHIFISYSKKPEHQTELKAHKFLNDKDIMRLMDFVNEHKSEKSFGDLVIEIMNKHEMDAPQVYKNAMLRRQDWSRLISRKCKGVKKSTVWSLIIGLRCNMEEAETLIKSVSRWGDKTEFDLILEFMINEGNYDILAINEILDLFGLPTLSVYTDVKDKDAF